MLDIIKIELFQQIETKETQVFKLLLLVSCFHCNPQTTLLKVYFCNKILHYTTLNYTTLHYILFTLNEIRYATSILVSMAVHIGGLQGKQLPPQVLKAY